MCLMMTYICSQKLSRSRKLNSAHNQPINSDGKKRLQPSGLGLWPAGYGNRSANKNRGIKNHTAWEQGVRLLVQSGPRWDSPLP
jgi:hypothetical protein